MFLTFLIVLAGWIFSLTLHEFAHALVAYLGGDTSVREKGYLTFNPLRYTHPVFSLVLPIIFLLAGGLALPGGAVYIEVWRLRSRNWETAVSLVGPLSNLFLAVVLGVFLSLMPITASGIWPGLAFLAQLQVTAALFNLIPLPPFDGYGAIRPHLPMEWQARLNRFGAYSIWVIFALFWFVPAVGTLFGLSVAGLALLLNIPLDIASLGYAQFFFWR